MIRNNKFGDDGAKYIVECVKELINLLKLDLVLS